jgi:ABC-type transporter Mla subunit MlaD
MSVKVNDFKLGLFVLFGIALLAAALFLFEGSRFLEGTTLQETYVPGSVEGLKKGTMVTLRGLPVGEVTRISFTWNVYHETKPAYAYVEFTVRKNRSLVPPGPDFANRVQDEVRRGLRARIKAQGLAGATILALEYLRDPQEYPPLPISWKPRHIYIPSAPTEMDELFSGLETTLSNVKQLKFAELSAALNRDLLSGQRVLDQLEQANLGTLGTNLNGLTTELRGTGRNLDALVDHLRGLSDRLEAFIGTAPQTNRAENLQLLSSRTDELLGQMSNLVERLDGLAAGLNGADLNQTLENTRQASSDLEQAARNLKQYPAGVLFGRPPPPAKSVERAPP